MVVDDAAYVKNQIQLIQIACSLVNVFFHNLGELMLYSVKFSTYARLGDIIEGTCFRMHSKSLHIIKCAGNAWWYKGAQYSSTRNNY